MYIAQQINDEPDIRDRVYVEAFGVADHSIRPNRSLLGNDHRSYAGSRRQTGVDQPHTMVNFIRPPRTYHSR